MAQHLTPASALRATMAACALLLLAASVPAQTLVDSDADGIPDDWERLGHGPLNPRIHDVRVGRKDVVVIATRRPGLSQATADASMLKLKQFFSRVPVRNPDGSTGINVVIVNGPILPESVRDPKANPYTAVYALGMPTEWRGIGHGVLLEEQPGGGGETVSPEWSAAGWLWQAVAHELGHQFGLDHTPPGSGLSPLFTSIMNYGYTYSFDDDPNAVHFSTGTFRSSVLNEARLNEVVNYPIETLRFLNRTPYNFSLRSAGPSVTHVDWDRDGVYGETSVTADINDGDGVSVVTPSLELAAAAGAPSLAPVGGRLYMVYPTLRTAANTWITSRPTRGAPLAVQVFNGSTFSAPTPLVSRTATSDPSAVGLGNKLAVAYVSGLPGRPGVPFVSLTDTTPTGLGASAEALDTTQMADQAVITSAPALGAMWVFTWDAATRNIRAVAVSDARAAGATTPRPQFSSAGSYQVMVGTSRLQSDNPIGAAYDTLTGKIVLASYGLWDGQDNRIRVTTLRLAGDRWVAESTRWVGNVTSGYWGNSAPVVVLDPTAPINGHSQITLYMRGGALPDELTVNYRLSEVADLTQHGGWRVAKMVDDWNKTQSPPAAALFNGAQVFALRWAFDDARIPNQVVFYKRTGVIDQYLLDYDEVRFLGNTGLRTSLERIRAYHGL
jgi:hypothetical protein